MRYLLDSNILADAIRHPQGLVARRMERHEAQVCTSIVVAAELRYGAEKRGSALLSENVERVLGRLDVMPLGVPADRMYGELRVRLERAGTPIGPNDLLIAAHALALGCVLVTDNEREFARVGTLAVENWLR